MKLNYARACCIVCMHVQLAILLLLLWQVIVAVSHNLISTVTMASSQSNMYTIFCIVKGDNTPFSVEIEPDKTIDRLKKAIKSEKPHRFDGFDADELTLYRIDVTERDQEECIRKVKNRNLSSLELLDPRSPLAVLYPCSPPGWTIHVLVQVPE
ncbi:hypothetical protein CPB86DRAFT_361226 [Serendipita vermifera]|nr:hypothetical protein CPB86DRAFT_361226 [Serendipita vermifera]